MPYINETRSLAGQGGRLKGGIYKQRSHADAKKMFYFRVLVVAGHLVQPSHCSLAKSSEFKMVDSEISKSVLEFRENFKLLLCHQNTAVHLGSF